MWEIFGSGVRSRGAAIQRQGLQCGEEEALLLPLAVAAPAWPQQRPSNPQEVPLSVHQPPFPGFPPAGLAFSSQAWRSTACVWMQTPSTASTTISAPSDSRTAVDTSLQKSMCPGESIRLTRQPVGMLKGVERLGWGWHACGGRCMRPGRHGRASVPPKPRHVCSRQNPPPAPSSPPSPFPSPTLLPDLGLALRARIQGPSAAATRDVHQRDGAALHGNAAHLLLLARVQEPELARQAGMDQAVAGDQVV